MELANALLVSRLGNVHYEDTLGLSLSSLL